ncbi:MAG: glycosyltransferase [Planctomycetales bacterium]|nr:glycosyltransferase [Planctomycetales bacterium]
MEFALNAYAILCILGLAQTVALLLFQREQHRFHRSRLRSECQLDRTPRVELFVPCKGLDLELEANLAKLFQQEYPNYGLCFIVESINDPAHEVIVRLCRRFSTPACRVVVAGIATDCGQKVHNLVAATRQIPDGVEVLAFADSDARPHPQWLSRLVQRLNNDKVGASTGYRWFFPQHISPPNWIACGINNMVSGVMGCHRFNLVWGGAWAMRVSTFQQLGLPNAWAGSLSDDLTISRLVHDARLKVAFEPHCLATSPVDFNWITLAEFVRRQFLVVRVYAPIWWLFAMGAATLTLVCLASSLILSVTWLVTGGPWWMPAICGTCYWALMGYRLSLRARMMAPFVHASPDIYRTIARREIFGWPIITLCHGMGLVASAVGRTIHWRGISYRLTSRHQTHILTPSIRSAEGISFPADVLASDGDQPPLRKAA